MNQAVAQSRPIRIALLGAGPSALFVLKHLFDTEQKFFTVDVFESGNRLGCGMPFSAAGAGPEHITNVSSDEVPELVTTLEQWMTERGLGPAAGSETSHSRSDNQVVPRLVFGEYLTDQFERLLERGDRKGLTCRIHIETPVKDISDKSRLSAVLVSTEAMEPLEFDHAIICIGHHWPHPREQLHAGYFDSPYPPRKLAKQFQSPIALLGSSLTAIDAVITLARQHGAFSREGSVLVFHPAPGCDDFAITMHSRNGLLPCVRIHLEDSHLTERSLSEEVLAKHIADNDGFLSLDFMYEQSFLAPLRERDPQLFSAVKDLTLEQFVEAMLARREDRAPFELFKAEYCEAQQSLREWKSVPWKELLAELSFAMNYPAKHLSAEDMIRLQDVLMPLIAVVIAFAPQSSSEEIIALHDAGRLNVIAVGDKCEVEPQAEGGVRIVSTDESGVPHGQYFPTFIDCTGQPHLSIDSFPFQTLVSGEAVVPARLKFRSSESAEAEIARGNMEVVADAGGAHFLRVPGVKISDDFRIVGSDGEANPRISLMAVPYIGGYNPDYSGLDFCDEASRRIVESIFQPTAPKQPGKNDTANS